MRERLPINEIPMWILFLIITGWLFFGCTSSSLKEENQRLTLTAIRIVMVKNAEIDSLKEIIEDCQNTKLLRVKK